jgi:rhodanese-related sulfurtransferase
MQQGVPAAKDPEVYRIAEFLAQGNCVLSDVRTSEEFASGSVPGALNIPLDDLPQRLSLLSSRCVESNGRVVVFCGAGQKSKMAQKLLKNSGYNVTDGINVPYMLEALRTVEARTA